MKCILLMKEKKEMQKLRWWTTSGMFGWPEEALRRWHFRWGLNDEKHLAVQTAGECSWQKKKRKIPKGRKSWLFKETEKRLACQSHTRTEWYKVQLEKFEDQLGAWSHSKELASYWTCSGKLRVPLRSQDPFPSLCHEMFNTCFGYFMGLI